MAKHQAQITATLNVQNKLKQHSDIRYPTYAALSLNITFDIRNLCRLSFSISHILPTENVYGKTAHER